MSLQSSSEFWDGITFWLAVVGTALLFVSVVTGIAARRFARSLSEEKSQQAQRDKRTHEQSLAEANLETTRLKLELERLKTPRNLSPEQQKRIGDTLRPFAPQSTEVVYQGDDEARRLRNQIHDVLRYARWGPHEPQPLVTTNRDPPFLQGVVVEVDPFVQKIERDAANALIDALRKEGLVVKGPFAAPNASTRIRVSVGNKP